MIQPYILQTIIKDSNYNLSLFSAEEIENLRTKVFSKTIRGKETAFVNCVVRDKEIQLKPEEVVRQLYAVRLMEKYGYAKKRLAFEYSVSFGREKKSADIVVFDKDRTDTAYIIVELKKPRLNDGKNQLRSYCNATGAPIGAWTNGEQIFHYNRKITAKPPTILRILPIFPMQPKVSRISRPSVFPARFDYQRQNSQ